MSLISIEALSSLPTYILLCCELLSEYLPHSYIFTVPTSGSELIEKARSLNFQQSLTLICYDKGNMQKSSAAYWALKASGFNSIHVLYGGIQACIDFALPLTSEVPVQAPKSTNLLEFNKDLLMTKAEFIQVDTLDWQNYCANFGLVVMYEMNKELSKENATDFLKTYGLARPNSFKAAIYGENSCFLAVVLSFLYEVDLVIVLDEGNNVNLEEKWARKSYSTIYVSLTESDMEDRESFKDEVDKATADHYLSPVSTETPKEEHISNGACRNCTLL